MNRKQYASDFMWVEVKYRTIYFYAPGLFHKNNGNIIAPMPVKAPWRIMEINHIEPIRTIYIS